MKTNEEKALFFKAAVLQNELLVKSGYVLIKEEWRRFRTPTLHGEDEVPHFCVTLSNQSNRLLLISLHFLNTSEYITCLLENIVEPDRFMLTDWMVVNGLADKQSMFDLNSYSLVFEAAIPAFFEDLNALLQTSELKRILEGSWWDEVPMDWGDMK